MEPEQLQFLRLFLAAGVKSDECYAQHLVLRLSGVPVNFSNLAALRKTKQATGRTKDLLDLENLPFPD